MNLKKNQTYQLKITDIGINGEGIGKIDNFAVFVENALPGETVEIKLVKIKKNYGYGKLIKIVDKSPFRIDAPCKYFDKCGGCNIQHLEYGEQLKFKTNFVKNCLEKIGKFQDVFVPLTLGMAQPFNYRNKAQFPLNKENSELNIGFFKARSHDIINIDTCLIQNDINTEILSKIKEFVKENNIEPYDEKTNKGLIRHLITRVAAKTNELIVCLVLNSTTFEYENELIEKLKDIANIKGIVLNFNTSRTNVILGPKIKTIWGESYITDYIGDLKFKISILSFYQINPTQTEVLYDKVLEFANLKGDEIVIDAYCGIGTISLFLAKRAKKVYGIEMIDAAINDAEFNSAENGLKNTEFIAGKAEEVIVDLIENKAIYPNVIVLDPPRKGCEKEMLEAIATAKPEKIVYVSCNPATLARDLAILCERGYKLDKIQPVDMFCFTTHVECVGLMTRVGERMFQKS